MVSSVSSSGCHWIELVRPIRFSWLVTRSYRAKRGRYASLTMSYSVAVPPAGVAAFESPLTLRKRWAWLQVSDAPLTSTGVPVAALPLLNAEQPPIAGLLWVAFCGVLSFWKRTV